MSLFAKMCIRDRVDPYVFTCTEASYVSGELLNTLADKSAVARFVIGDANAPDMELIVSCLLYTSRCV